MCSGIAWLCYIHSISHQNRIIIVRWLMFMHKQYRVGERHELLYMLYTFFVNTFDWLIVCLFDFAPFLRNSIIVWRKKNCSSNDQTLCIEWSKVNESVLRDIYARHCIMSLWPFEMLILLWLFNLDDAWSHSWQNTDCMLQFSLLSL